MLRYVTVLTLVVVAGSCSASGSSDDSDNASSQPAPGRVQTAPGSNPALEEEFETLHASYLQAVNELDLEVAERLWSQREPISFIHPRGHERGWAEIRQNFYVQTMGLLPTRQLSLRDVSIHSLTPETAWVDLYWDFEAEFEDGTPLNTTGRETQVWKKETDGWKLIHVHYSGPATQGAREGF